MPTCVPCHAVLGSSGMTRYRSLAATSNHRSRLIEGNSGCVALSSGTSPSSSNSFHQAELKSYRENFSFDPETNAYITCVADVFPLLFDPTKIEMSEASSM